MISRNTCLKYLLKNICKKASAKENNLDNVYWLCVNIIEKFTIDIYLFIVTHTNTKFHKDLWNQFWAQNKQVSGPKMG